MIIDSDYMFASIQIQNWSEIFMLHFTIYCGNTKVWFPWVYHTVAIKNLLFYTVTHQIWSCKCKAWYGRFYVTIVIAGQWRWWCLYFFADGGGTEPYLWLYGLLMKIMTQNVVVCLLIHGKSNQPTNHPMACTWVWTPDEELRNATRFHEIHGDHFVPPWVKTRSSVSLHKQAQNIMPPC